MLVIIRSFHLPFLLSFLSSLLLPTSSLLAILWKIPEEGVVDFPKLPIFQQSESSPVGGGTSQSSEEGAIGANGIVDSGAEKGDKAKKKE